MPRSVDPSNRPAERRPLTRAPLGGVSAAALITSTLLHLAGPRALAHSETVVSDPVPGAVLAASPDAVTVGFTDLLGPGSTISVVDRAFANVENGPAAVDPADRHRMRVGLMRGLPEGTYTVAWTAVDAGDGHRTSGSFTFDVGAKSSGGKEQATRLGLLGAALALVLVVLTGAAAVRRRARAGAAVVALVGGALLLAPLGGCTMNRSAGTTPAASEPYPPPGERDANPRAGPSTAASTPGAEAAGASAATSDATAEADAGVPIQIAIAASDLAVGQERFSFAILDVDNKLIPDVKATATFFRLEGDAAEETGTVPATYYPSRLAEAGTYVALTAFDRAGPWGVAIGGTLPDGRSVAPNRVRFEVATRPRSPAVGDAVPPTANRTLATVPDIALLTSDPAPDPRLYALTVDDAIASGKPTVVVFVTPGYCQSRICGPVLDEVKAVAAEWRDRVNFIHLEVYKTFSPLVLSDEMESWGLETEPWTFVLTREGRVAARLEGNATRAELEPLLRRVVGGG